MDSVIVRPSLESSSPRATGSAPPSPGEYKRAIARSWKMYRGLGMSVVLVVVLGFVAFALTRKPYYETTALVYVQPQKSRIVTDPADGSYDAIRYDSYIQQQMQTILRSDTLTEALHKADAKAGHEVWKSPGESEQSAVSRLEKTLKVEREMGSYQLSLTMTGGNAKDTTILLNSVVETYISKERLDELAQNDQQLTLLRENRNQIMDELERDRQEQAQLSSHLGVADPNSGAGSSWGNQNQFDAQLGQLRTQLAEANSARDLADAQLASVTGDTPETIRALNAAADQTFDSDPGLAALKETINKHRSELAAQMAALTPKHPLYKQDEDEIKKLDQSLDQMTGEMRAKAAQQVLDKLRLQAARARDVQARLEGDLQRQTMIATGATTKLQRASMLSSDMARLQARFTEVDNAINALALEHDSSGLVHLLVPAEEPLSPKTSRRWMILAAALPLGLVFGTVATLVCFKLSSKVYIAGDVESALGFPPIAVLPKSGSGDTEVSDEFMLRLVAGIDQAHTVGGAKTFLFTPASADTEAGDVVSSLASRMNLLGYRTLILKASAALNDGSAIQQERVKDAWPDTRLATVGEKRIAELKRSSSAAENLERLKQNVDLIFLEALPLLSSAEAEFAARLADVTVMVIESGKTTGADLRNCLRLAKRLNVSGLAALVNHLELRHADGEFLAAVRSVQKRHVEIRSASETDYRRRKQKNKSISIYSREDVTAEDLEKIAKA